MPNEADRLQRQVQELQAENARLRHLNDSASRRLHQTEQEHSRQLRDAKAEAAASAEACNNLRIERRQLTAALLSLQYRCTSSTIQQWVDNCELAVERLLSWRGQLEAEVVSQELSVWRGQLDRVKQLKVHLDQLYSASCERVESDSLPKGFSLEQVVANAGQLPSLPKLNELQLEQQMQQKQKQQQPQKQQQQQYSSINAVISESSPTDENNESRRLLFAQRYLPKVKQVLPHASLATVAMALQQLPTTVWYSRSVQSEQQRASAVSHIVNYLFENGLSLEPTACSNGDLLNGEDEEEARNHDDELEKEGEGGEEEEVCPICQESLQRVMRLKATRNLFQRHRQHQLRQQQLPRQLTCGHRFHTVCIERWLAECSACPTCRQLYLKPEDYPALG